MTNLEVNYNKIVPTYNERYNENTFSGTLSELMKIIKNCIPKRVLDVGCGIGHWLSKIKEFNLQIVGLDFSFEMLK